MKSLHDTQIFVPAEHFEEFSKVIRAGLQKANIRQDVRNSLASWWLVEREIISGEMQ